MNKIKWGIIGCGDVTEIKSGPGFSKADNSELVAVMRRDAQKAADYARRHNVPRWYTDANDLINDPQVDAVYVATPPLYHLEYTMASLKAGKPVYVEKPMTLNAEDARKMTEAEAFYNSRLSVAHYRRALPLFIKIKELLDAGAIGDVRFVNLKMLQPHNSDLITKTHDNWRVNPEVSGGGLFHDLAPHQLDLMLFYFGKVKSYHGLAVNQAAHYPADDLVTGEILFENNVIFQGLWCFTVAPQEKTDQIEIVGSKGTIRFAVFGQEYYEISIGGKTERFEIATPEHIQQPMIQKVVNYFLGKEVNPSTATTGLEVMSIIDSFCGKK
jgi:predicted dehydrogenase